MSRGTINKAILVGRLGKDPEMKYTPSGTAVASFSIATNYSMKDSEGNFVDKTDWHNIVVFGRRAEFAGEYMNKGRLVYIEGRIQTRSWEDKEGNKRYMTEIIASDVQLLGSKGENTSKETEEPDADVQSKDVPAQEDEEADDLPF
ncbi:MAG: single-stranded DNA-binding protein [Calditrichia bacterium]|nr:single-stranded DNA-binding protein [Calditrichia bacterium]